MVTIFDFDGKPVDAYSKDEVIAMLTELKEDALASSEAIQQKIDELEDNKENTRMTTSDAIEGLQAIQKYYNNDTIPNYLGFNKADNETMDTAIKIIQKYQQLEQIINDCWKTDGGVFQMTDNYYLKKIGEILDN